LSSAFSKMLKFVRGKAKPKKKRHAVMACRA